jgi:NADH:ubiquinone reductase (H+-translocating)
VEGAATGIDLAGGHVEVGRERIGFDRLLLATGSLSDRGRVPGAAEHTHALDGAAAARALHAALPASGDVLVVGGGLTGLETASELAERRGLRVTLATSGELGHGLSDGGRAYLRTALDRLGVTVAEHARVRAVEPGGAILADGGRLPFTVAVWCGGFTGRPLARAAGLSVDGLGRVRVDAALRSVSHAHVLACGDAAAHGLRMSCQAGMPSGVHAAETIAAELAGREPEPFAFGFLAQCVSLGRRDGLLQWVDRADRPKPGIVTGRPAAFNKAIVTSGVLSAIRLEHRFPGSLRFPGPDKAATLEAVAA